MQLSARGTDISDFARHALPYWLQIQAQRAINRVLAIQYDPLSESAVTMMIASADSATDEALLATYNDRLNDVASNLIATEVMHRELSRRGIVLDKLPG